MSDNDGAGWASVSCLRARGYCAEPACYMLIMEQPLKPPRHFQKLEAKTPTDNTAPTFMLNIPL